MLRATPELEPGKALQDQTKRGSVFDGCVMRYALIAFGWLNVALGTIGVIVPGMPTTIFLLIALWAFSKSSERFRVWLYNHKTFGPPLRAWHEHGAISTKAKILAITVMASSVTILAVFVAENAMLPLIVTAILLPIAGFIVTRPSGPLEHALDPEQISD